MIECIFYGKVAAAKSIEHIVSESLGNTTYLLGKGSVFVQESGYYNEK